MNTLDIISEIYSERSNPVERLVQACTIYEQDIYNNPYRFNTYLSDRFKYITREYILDINIDYYLENILYLDNTGREILSRNIESIDDDRLIPYTTGLVES